VRPLPRLSRSDTAMRSLLEGPATVPPLREVTAAAAVAQRDGGGAFAEARLPPIDVRARVQESAFESSCGHSSVVLDSPLSAPVRLPCAVLAI
jgi:hypothetical protein